MCLSKVSLGIYPRPEANKSQFDLPQSIKTRVCWVKYIQVLVQLSAVYFVSLCYNLVSSPMCLAMEGILYVACSEHYYTLLSSSTNKEEIERLSTEINCSKTSHLCFRHWFLVVHLFSLSPTLLIIKLLLQNIIN